MRLDDPAGAQQAVDEVKAIARVPGLSSDDQEIVAKALREIAEL